MTDPLFTLAAVYLEATRQLNCSTCCDDDVVDAFCTAHMDPVRDRVIEDCPIPVTKAGALAALRLAELANGQGDYEMSAALIAPVATFLEAHEVVA
jgi:hypothetical protein